MDIQADTSAAHALRHQRPGATWIRRSALVLIAGLAAALNSVIIGATFPALTLMDSLPASLVFAACAGIALVLSPRFPLWTLAGQAAVCFVVASVPSLSFAALIVGLRHKMLSWQTIATVCVSAAAITVTPWLPPGGRLMAPLIVVLPFGVGSLIRATRNERLAHEERLRMLTANAILREEQAASRERERITDELHDRLGHQLTAIEIQARTMAAQPEHPEQVRTRADLVRDQAVQALDSIQSLLHPSARPTPQSATVSRSLASTVSRSADRLNVTISPSYVDIEGIPFDIDYVLLRVIEEGLTNAARHAPGQEVRLSVRRESSRVVCRMTNPMIAVDGSTDAPGGRGLTSLARRVAEVDGMFTARAHQSGSFFELVAAIPLSAEGSQR